METWADTPEEEFGEFKRVNGVYAHRGEPIVCEQGHLICKFTRDVLVGEPFDPKAMGEWKQREPEIGELASPCERCGSRWFKHMYFHFKDGWRI